MLKEGWSFLLFPKIVILLLLIVSCYSPARVYANCSTLNKEGDSDQIPLDSVRLFDDPRVINWSRDFLAGNLDRVLQSVEEDLSGPSFHPFAPHIWTVIQHSKGQLEEAWQDIKRRDCLWPHAALSPLPDIYPLFLKGKYKIIINKYPSSQADEIKNLWALNYLIDSAMQEERYQIAMRYLLASLRIRTDYFRTAWFARDLGNSNEEVRAELMKLVGPGGDLSDTMFGRFVYEVLRYRPLDARDELVAVEKWLQARPLDASALRFKGENLLALNRLDDAVETFNKSTLAYGFPIGDWSSLTTQLEARALIKIGKFDEARQVIARDASVQFDEAENKDLIVEWRMASALMDAGERGEARRGLDKAFAIWPNHAGLLATYARLELQSDRPGEAVSLAQKAIGFESTRLDYRNLLIEALQKKGDLGGALVIFEKTEKEFTQKSVSFFQLGSSILADLGKNIERVQLCERAIKEYPESAWLLRELSDALEKTGSTSQAVERLRKAIDMNGPGKWSIDKMRELVSSISGEEKIEEELRNLRIRFPWVLELWEDMASHAKGPDTVDQQVEIWKKAAEVNPGRNWPWEKINDLLVSNKRWDEATADAKEALKKAVTIGDRGDALEDLIWVTIRRTDGETVDTPKLEQTLKNIEEYRNNNGFISQYYRHKANIMEALGRKKEAAEAALEAARLNPDHWERVGQLITKYANELEGKQWAILHRYVDRNPYDGNRLRNVIEMHIQWGGSQIIALQLVHRLEKITPEKISKEVEAMAWGKLGDYRRQFDVNYSRAEHIPASDRYVGQYEEARLNAQRGTLKVELDYDTGIAKITSPDGRIVLRQDHPDSGKPVLIQSGAAFIRVEYDTTGINVQRIVTSSGIEIHMTYDNQDRISSIQSNRGNNIQFQYNDMDKPTRISVEGVGYLEVEYDTAGNVLDTTSYPGDEGGSIGLKIMTTMNEMLGFLSKLSAGWRGEIPNLPYKDPELDKLRKAYNTKTEKDSNDTASLPVAESALLLGRYLTDHAGDNPDYAEEANKIIDHIIVLMQRPKWPKIQKEKERLVEIGLEAIDLWYKFRRTVNPDGLSVDDWVYWAKLQDMLQDLRKLTMNESLSLQTENIIREIEEKPLVLNNDNRWLPYSPLSIPVFWHKYPLNKIMPFNKHTHSTDFNAILIRRNADVVVGTNSGISVLKGGSWESFDLGDGKSFSAVLSLAEDDEGRLWIGTENGLILLSGGYEETPKIWKGQEDGLSSPRIEHLAPYRKGVLVVTPNGLQFFTTSGATNEFATLFNGVPILKIRSFYYPDDGNGDELVLLAMKDGLYKLSEGHVDNLLEGKIDDVCWLAGEKEVYILRDGELYVAEWADSKGKIGKLRHINSQQGFIKTKDIHGIENLSLNGRDVLTILTDKGVYLFQDEHFEYLKLTPSETGSPLIAMTSDAQRIYIMALDGVYEFDYSIAKYDNSGKVYDILSADEMGMTFVAHGTDLQIINQNNLRIENNAFQPWYEGDLLWSIPIHATHLALDLEGNLIANDEQYGKTDIIRIFNIEGSDFKKEILFTVDDARITSLLSASDGSIWVTAGPSVFRWKDGNVEEFSMIKNSVEFPSRSDMISRVIETVDGHIWVVASNEKHRFQSGMSLEGGLLEWTGTGFRRLSISSDAEGHTQYYGPWFITGYTPIDNETAIVSSTEGFALHRGDSLKTFKEIKDTSYDALLRRTPLLWLGTRGTKLKDGTWLFGSAGGVVAYKEGKWSYPERLNQMLPDQYLSNYGALTVNAISQDRAGHIYVGTDRGLLIYTGSENWKNVTWLMGDIHSNTDSLPE